MNHRALVHFVLASGIGAALRFLLFPILSGTMAPEEFGKVGLYLATAPFLALAMGWSMVTPWVIGYHERDERASRELLGGLMASNLLFWSLLCLVGWIFHERFAAWVGPGLDATGVLEAISSATLANVSSAFLELDKIRQESRRYLLSSLAQSVLQVGIALLFVRLTTPTFPMFLHGYLLGSVGIVALQAAIRRGTGPLLPRFSETRRLWVAALPISVTTAFGLVASLGDRHFVEAVSGLASVAVYMMAAKIGEIAQQLVHIPVVAAMTPVLLSVFGKDRANFPARYEAEMRRLLVLSLLATSALAAGANLAFSLLLPASYATGIPITILFLLAFAIGAIGDGLALPVLVHGRLKTFARFTAISAMVSLGANAWLTPRFGLVGAAVAGLVVHVMILVLAWISARRLPGRQRFDTTTRLLIGLTIAIPTSQAIVSFAVSDPSASSLARWGLWALGLIILWFGPFRNVLLESIPVKWGKPG